MSQIFLKVLDMSLGASFLVLAVVAARFLLKKAPKWIRLLLWALVAVRLLLPVTPESSASLVPDTSQLTTKAEVALEAPILPAQPQNPPIVLSPGNTIPTADAVVPTATAAVPEPSPSPAPAPAQGPSLLTVLAWIWLGGIAVMALATAISYLRLRKRVTTAVRLKDRVYQSENVVSPFILGLLRPRIYLPFHMDGQSVPHVLAHEYAHLKRKDHLWKPLGFALLTAHWFNPLMWLGYILLCRDIELACDEKVIKGLDVAHRADYSQALLSSSVSRRSIAACPLAFGEIGVGQRIKSVLSYKKPTFWLILVALIACIAVAVCFLTNPPQTDDPAPQGALPEDIPEPYTAILSDYSAIVDFRLSENFIEDYNNGVRPEISDTLDNCIEDELEYHFSCMLIEMAKGIDGLSKESFGYILQDVNRDGSAELFWVRDDYTILAAFTIRDGQVKMIDAFWPRHAMIATDEGFLYTRSSDGADYTSFRLSKLDADGTLSEVVAFGTEGLAYYEMIGSEKETIDEARFEALVSKYPFEASAAWRKATIYTAMPESSTIGQPANDDSLFLITDTPENLASIQLPSKSEVMDNALDLMRTFILSQIETNFDAEFALKQSVRDVANNGRDYTGCYLRAQSRVAYRSENLVSVVFTGRYNQRGAAHPIHFLWALNYDPQTLETVNFAQQYQVNATLYGAFSEAAEKEILEECSGKWPEGWGSFAEELCSEERFLKGLSEGGDFQHYFTTEGVVISYPVSFALGSHKEALLPYSSLTARLPGEGQAEQMQPPVTQPEVTQPQPPTPVNCIHLMEEIVTKAPSCTQKGEGENRCTLCGYSEAIVYDATAHRYGDYLVTKQATCIEEGYRKRTCLVCGRTQGQKTEKTYHIWNKMACNTPVTCTVCGYHEADGFPHQYELVNTYNYSSGFLGTRNYGCMRCGGWIAEHFGQAGDYDFAALQNHVEDYARGLEFAVSSVYWPGKEYTHSVRFAEIDYPGGGIEALQTLAKDAIDQAYGDCIASGMSPADYEMNIQIQIASTTVYGQVFYQCVHMGKITTDRKEPDHDEKNSLPAFGVDTGNLPVCLQERCQAGVGEKPEQLRHPGENPAPYHLAPAA